MKCRLSIILLIPALLAISCSHTETAMESGSRVFPSSALGDAVNTMSIDSLEMWVRTHPEDLDALNVLYGRLELANEHDRLINQARPLFQKALAEGNDLLAVYTGTYIGQAFSLMFKPDSMYRYFDLIYDKARKMELKFPLLVLNNLIGVSNLTYSMNYSEALFYFYEALKYCDKSNPRNRLLLLWNIVNTYYLREGSDYPKSDTEGIEYALEIYNYGKDNNDSYILYMGTIACAYMYYIKGDYATALDYVRQSMDTEYYKNGINSSDALHANILAAMGRNDEAEQYFRKSTEQESGDYSTIIESQLSYGQFLAGQGRYQEAIAHYLEGIRLTEEHSLFFYGHRLYNALSEAYAAIGKDSLALRYMRTYQSLTDSVFNIEKERSFSNLRRNYEQQRHQNEVQELNIRILSEKKKRLTLIFLTVLTVISAGGIILWFHRRQRMYKQLVKNYDTWVNTQQAPTPEQKIRSVHNMPPEDKENPEDRISGIFMTAEHYMQDIEIFRDSELTIESLAKKIGTNQTYLSKAINTYAKSSFRDYVNAYRIRYAVKLLSDPDNDQPIKEIAAQAGYNNLQSFYQNFRKETDVPPSRYRETIRKLKKEQQN